MSLLNKLSKASLLILAGLLPLALWAVFHVPIGTADVHQWLPEGRVERQRYEQFLKNFGSDQVLLVSWDDATLDDSRVAEFSKLIEKEADSGDYLTSVVSPLEIITSLEQPPLNFTRKDAVERLTGTLIGQNGTVAIVISVSQQGVLKHRQTIELVRQLADSIPQLGRQKLRLVGSVYESFAIDEAAEHSLSKLVLPSTFLALLISWICVGSFRAVCVVMLLAGSGQLVAISVVYYGGYQFSAVMIVLPTLIFMLTLSGAVHLVNYLLDAKQKSANAQVVEAAGFEAVATGWWPCTLSSATTMLGMGSLLTSELSPVRQFGILSALCLGVATVLLLLAFPATADLVFYLNTPIRRMLNRFGLLTRATETTEPKLLSIPKSAQRIFLNWQLKYANWISAGSLILLAVVIVGLSRLKSSTKVCDMFPEQNKTHQDMLWFEKNVGPIATVEVLLHFERNEDANLLDQAKLVVKVSQELRKSTVVGGSYSAANFFPELSDATGIRATTVRAAQKRNLEANLYQLQGKGLLFQNEQETIWRVSTRVSAMSSAGYGELTQMVAERVRRAIDEAPIRSNVEAPLRSKVDQPIVELTGLSPVLHETQSTLLSDLGYSFLSAYLLITPAMMLVVRSFWGGILIMLPNILPIALAFGAMGWLNWSLDIAGVLTASIALGIAVDDTLHFVCWYMRELKAGCSRAEAVRRSFHACSSAMMHTTLISCCSMVPFLFADFVPTQQFATLMISILIAALAGDLILLPALLLSPVGKVIRES